MTRLGSRSGTSATTPFSRTRLSASRRFTRQTIHEPRKSTQWPSIDNAKLTRCRARATSCVARFSTSRILSEGRLRATAVIRVPPLLATFVRRHRGPSGRPHLSLLLSYIDVPFGGGGERGAHA